MLGKADRTGDYWAQRVLIILACAAVGVLGLSGLIGITSRVLLPYEVTLADLPDMEKVRIESAASSFLPGGLTSIDAFREELRDLEIQTRKLESRVALWEKRVEREKAKVPQDPARLRTAEEHLDAFRAGWKDTSGNLAVYRAARDDVLAQVGYRKVRDLYSGSALWLVAWGLAAVLGAAGYLLAIGFEAEKKESAADPERPSLALLMQRDTDSSRELWAAAALVGCQLAQGADVHDPLSAGDHPGGERPVVPVLVEDGTGTTADPYVVRTLPSDTCPVVRFAVIEEVAHVTFPEEEIHIKYETTTTTTT